METLCEKIKYFCQRTFKGIGLPLRTSILHLLQSVLLAFVIRVADLSKIPSADSFLSLSWWGN